MAQETRFARRWSGAWVAVLFVAALGCDAGSGEPRSSVEVGVEASDELVGGPCMTSKECPTEEYCVKAAGECSREGVCTPTPTSCETLRDPVCSCDGLEYRNTCWAALDKQNVDFAGDCPPPPCTSNLECDASEYCAKATGDCTGTGSCQARPISCSGVYNPVCGCNSKTYANGCKAAAVGVAVKQLGAC